MLPTEFTVTENHIKLLERTYVGWMDYAYDGAPGVNPKRPFGNSDVMRDVYEIIHDGKVPEGVDEDEFWEDFYDQEHPDLMTLFREMEYVVQIALQCAGRREAIEPVTYYRPELYDTRLWVQR